MKLKRATSLTMAFSLGLACVAATDAKAGVFRHFPATMCVALNGASGGAYANDGAQEYNGATTTTFWACPVIDDSNMSVATGSVYLQLWVSQNSVDAISATDCDTYWDGSGYECDATSAESGSTGIVGLSKATTTASPWYGANAADTKWILVEVGGTTSGTNYNTIFGYGWST